MSKTILWLLLNGIHLTKKLQQVPNMNTFPFLRVNYRPRFRGVWTSTANVILRFLSTITSIVCLLTLFPCPAQPGWHLPCESTVHSLFAHLRTLSCLASGPPSFIFFFSSSAFCHARYVLCLLRYRKLWWLLMTHVRTKCLNRKTFITRILCSNKLENRFEKKAF